MRSAPFTGWERSSLSNRASAGGQLEQPSDVNNSTSTGVRAVSLLLGLGAGFASMYRTETPARIENATKRLVVKLKRIILLSNRLTCITGFLNLLSSSTADRDHLRKLSLANREGPCRSLIEAEDS